MAEGAADVRWAPRVSRSVIKRLYESDARGRVDEELLDEAFFGFLARCHSIRTATQAAYGRVACPRCGEVVLRQVGGAEEKEEPLRCAGCGWQTSWGAYHQTYRGKKLFGGNAAVSGVFDEFIRRAPGADSPHEKMLLVDWIIHEAHRAVRGGREELHRPVAVNLIEGRMRELIAFLDELAYGPASTHGLRERAEEWRADVRPRLGRKQTNA